ncbi:MAG: ATP-binding protein [Gaiellales bacterium]
MAPDVRGFEFKLPAEPDSVVIVRRALRALLRDVHIDRERVADIVLATTEACTNAVLHAYPGQEGVFHAGASLPPGQVVVVVRDHGAGLGRERRRSDLGVGLGLSAALADDLQIETLLDFGTEVRLSFRLGDPPPQPRRRFTGR